MALGAINKLDAIVIGGLDYGESDRIVHLLSPSLGRMSVMAKRARSSQRRFSGAFDMGNRVALEVRQGRGRLPTVNQAMLQAGREGVRQNLESISLLAYAVEVCGSLAREDHPEPRLFGLLETASVILDVMNGVPQMAFRLALEAKALTFAGLCPVLQHCARCENPLAEKMGWAHSAGGSVHLDCGPVDCELSLMWLNAIETYRRTPLKDLIDTQPPKGPPFLLADTIEAHLGRPLRSRSILTSLATV